MPRSRLWWRLVPTEEQARKVLDFPILLKIVSPFYQYIISALNEHTSDTSMLK